jgi:hypothetical protein
LLKYIILFILLTSCSPNVDIPIKPPGIEIHYNKPWIATYVAGECLFPREYEFNIPKESFDKIIKVGNRNYLIIDFHDNKIREREESIMKYDLDHPDLLSLYPCPKWLHK